MKKLRLKALQHDQDRLKRLEELHDKAAKEGAEIFEFEGNMCLTTYAKYLIEFLKSELRTGVVIDDGDYDGSEIPDDDEDSGVEID